MDLSGLADAVIKGDISQVTELTKKALNEHTDLNDIINNGLIAGMNVIGERFKNNEIFIPEVMISAHAMHAGMEILKPLFSAQGVEPKGVVIIATVKGDVHDIGKNLVAMMFESAGFKVIDLGIDIDAVKIINAIKEHEPNILALSTLLTTTLENMKEIIETMKTEGLREDVLVMIGGAAVNETFATELGADGYAKDASLAVDKAKELMGI
ncbi:MAG: corrinoid protein [Thermoplasmata archaeon]|nr:corrinoid protein [Thermoplasmata archaeon]